MGGRVVGMVLQGFKAALGAACCVLGTRGLAVRLTLALKGGVGITVGGRVRVRVTRGYAAGPQQVHLFPWPQCCSHCSPMSGGTC